MREIPVIDLATQYRSMEAEINSAILRVLARANFILGDEVASLEKEFAEYCGAKFGIGVASGTDALFLALRACNIGPGDEVLVPAHTSVATVTAIELTGARPALVDVDLHTFTLDPLLIERHISPRTRAIVPVHLYGYPADMSAILEIAAQTNLCVIEDCAQAHGATYKGRKTGNWGHLSAFSFYPTKNLGAFGDAGMVLTDEPDLMQRVSLLRQYGWEKRYVSVIRGVNSRLDEIQAAILRVKLKYLDEWNKRRREIAGIYNGLLADCGVALPHIPEISEPVYHQYAIRSRRRDELREFLAERSIQTAIHYPVPIHLQPAFKDLGYEAGDFPNTERICSEVLSLPIYPEIAVSTVEVICRAIREFQHVKE